MILRIGNKKTAGGFTPLDPSFKGTGKVYPSGLEITTEVFTRQFNV